MKSMVLYAGKRRTMDYNKVNNIDGPKGILLLIGGHEEKSASDSPDTEHPMEILKEFISLTGKPDPIIEIVTTASSKGEELFNDYKKAFEEIGMNTVGHIHHDKRYEVLSDSMKDRLRKADGIFFSGGDQLKLTSVYGGTTFFAVIYQRYIKESIVIAGTSAGAMALGNPMIFAGNKQKQQLAGGVSVAQGLGPLNSVCIDTHFVDRSRFVRMAQVIAMNPASIGIGIEEDTAIIIKNGKDVDAIGNGVVIIIDGYNISDSNVLEHGTGKPISIKDLNVKLLARGSQFEIPSPQNHN